MTTIQEAFRARATAAPERIAVRGDDHDLTYAELDTRADEIASRLVAHGVVPGSKVGVLARRSPGMVVTLLGILKAGAAYVAVDPRQPAGWRATALASAGVHCVTDASGALTGPVKPAERTPADLAYVAFTSGSTGVPKGVAVPHEAVLRLVLHQPALPVGPDERFLQFAPVAFDASTFEIWAPLLNGAELVVFPPGEESLAELAKFVRTHEITTLWLSAGLFQQVVDRHVDELAGVRRLVVGGDVVSPRHAALVLERVPGLRLVNGYGPTENTTFTCCHDVTADAAAPVPIGRPIAGTGVRVLDARLRPTDVGELYATGTGLARGYVGAPEATAARFVADPWSTSPGARMYRTGDLVRRRADGVLEFLGRADEQVKINGFRVEPGEVETALAAQPGVREVAVVAQPGPAGALKLVAFVAPQRGQTVSVLGLRRSLTDTLPDYARPAAYRIVNELPLTTNGKVDRRALAEEVSRDRPDLFTDYVPPRTPVETLLAQMWSDLLGIDGIGVDDDFVVLGGYSLLSMRMTADIAKEFGVTVSPREFYLRPTVAGLSALVEERTR
ncbi:amino acid adenylation domain-containing protein [Amycolatopsis sp. NPDC005003]